MSKCIHGRQKSQCKPCFGSSICIHGRIKQRCRECCGSSFCSHGKRKNYCKECGGGSICSHGTIRTKCRECTPNSFCIHGKDKTQCNECSGSSICSHGNRKSYCKKCDGNSICIHGITQYICKECCGTGICSHGKHKAECKKCGGSNLCKSVWCETQKNNPKYEGYCFVCFVNLFPEKPNVRNYKTKEKDVNDRIDAVFSNFTWVNDKQVEGGCSRRRPDKLLDLGSHIIIVEVDENKHTNYDCSCENKRLMLLSQDLQHRPIVFIRFNPDNYINQEGVLVKSCWKLNKLGVMTVSRNKLKEWVERIECLKNQIQYWIDNTTEKTIEIIELFY